MKMFLRFCGAAILFIVFVAAREWLLPAWQGMLKSGLTFDTLQLLLIAESLVAAAFAWAGLWLTFGRH